MKPSDEFGSGSVSFLILTTRHYRTGSGSDRILNSMSDASIPSLPLRVLYCVAPINIVNDQQHES